MAGYTAAKYLSIHGRDRYTCVTQQRPITSRDQSPECCWKQICDQGQAMLKMISSTNPNIAFLNIKYQLI